MEKGLILFNLHPPAAAITLLTASQVMINLGYIDFYPSRKAFNDSRQAGTV